MRTTVSAMLGAVGGFVLAATVLAAPAFADTPQRLCETFDPTPGTAGSPLDAQIREQADLAERALGAAAQGAPRYTPPSAARDDGATPSLDSRAAYCLAIGELIRRGGYDNPLNAPGYLQAAFQYAEQAHDNARAALAAFRLGLTLATGGAGEGERGAQRRSGPVRTDTPLAAQDQDGESRGLGRVKAKPGVRSLTILDEPTGAAACEALLDQQAVIFAFHPGVALSCAAYRGDPDLAAQSDLKFARLLLAQVETAPAQAVSLRRRAVDIISARLSAPGARPRPDLTARLAEAAVDAMAPGEPVDAAVRDAIAGLEADTVAGADAGVAASATALHARLVGLADCGIALNDRIAPGAPCPGARTLLERAVALESRRSTPDRMADWYMLMAKADPEHADADVRSAYSALEGVRATLPLRDPLTEESTFQGHERGVFEARIGALLAAIPAADRLNKGQEAELNTAQNILEDFRQAEVSDALGNECITVPLRVQSQNLKAGELILYPVLLPDRVELIYLRGGGNGQFRRLPLTDLARHNNRESVARLVGAMRRALTSDDPQVRAQWEAPAATLYDLLIRPIEGRLSPHQTLVVIPDATLTALPFSALLRVDGGKREYLIQETRLVIAPSLAYAQPGPTRAGRKAFVAAGSLNEDVPLAFHQQFPRLANASLEARLAAGWQGDERALAKDFDDRRPPAGVSQTRPGLYLANFTEDSLSRELRTRNVDILHLATHASFSGGTDKSFIVANGGFITLRELSGIIADNKARGKQLDLLVLSACETAVGDDSASLGLAGAAVQAGARGAIASLWEVNDESTKSLMVNFYRAYRGGASKGEAMQSAELAVMKEHPYPYFWASLILIGGWR